MPAAAELRHPLHGLDPALRRQLLVLFLGRGAGSWTMRFAYPFLPTIARGLDVPLATTGAIFGAVELLGLLAPVVGRRLDRTDARRGLVLGSALLGVGGVVAGLSSGTAAFVAGVLVLGTGFVVYTIASSTWTGGRVPIERRGGAIGLLETSWALSFLLGVPAAAALVTAGSWQTPFLVIGLVNLALAATIATTVEATAAPPAATVAPRAMRTALRRHRGFAATLGLLGLGGMMVISTYGAWLEDVHGFDAGGIGALAVLLGAAELVGSGASMLWGDRLGLRRTMAIGLAALAPALALTAPLGGGPVGALVLLFAVFAAFELAFVSGLTIASELDHEARASAIGLAIAGATVGRSIGAALGVWVLVHHGMGAAGALGAAAVLGALAVGRRAIPDLAPSPDLAPTP